MLRTCQLLSTTRDNYLIRSWPISLLCLSVTRSFIPCMASRGSVVIEQICNADREVVIYIFPLLGIRVFCFVREVLF